MRSSPGSPEAAWVAAWPLFVAGGAVCCVVGPAHQTDDRISQYPIVVVANWNEARFTEHNLIEANVCKQQETCTELNVLRVLRGGLKAGRHTVMFGWGVARKSDGTGLAPWTGDQ